MARLVCLLNMHSQVNSMNSLVEHVFMSHHIIHATPISCTHCRIGPRSPVRGHPSDPGMAGHSAPRLSHEAASAPLLMLHDVSCVTCQLISFLT